MTLRYASRLTVGDRVKFDASLDREPLTVSSFDVLSDGSIAIGYAELDGRGGVYQPRTILDLASD